NKSGEFSIASNWGIISLLQLSCLLAMMHHSWLLQHFYLIFKSELFDQDAVCIVLLFSLVCIWWSDVN
ncbi:hypothetical protein, partial [Streptococcus pyogenes]|uniref:hypothetical protein n=1 Tax=Streptococcus pyogenes TaxID=1314 RepID=UPI003DA021A8